MKRMSMLVLVLLLAASAVSAHDGSIGVYTSQAAVDCDATFNPFTPTDLYIMYYRSDSGPDGITGAELRLELSSAQVSIISFTNNPNTITNGTLATGIGIVFTTDCFGAGEDYVLLGTVQLMSLGAPAGWVAMILGDPRSEALPGLNVSICDTNKSLQPVIGGWFIGEEGACNVGTQPSTWGAVKSLYNN